MLSSMEVISHKIRSTPTHMMDEAVHSCDNVDISAEGEERAMIYSWDISPDIRSTSMHDNDC